MNLTEEIREYYERRQLLRPDVWEALGWLSTELAEVYEILLSRKDWIRNNPEKHTKSSKEDLAEELGDVIFMAVVAGMVEGVDPIAALHTKMKRKLDEKVAKMLSEGKLITEEEMKTWTQE